MKEKYAQFTEMLGGLNDLPPLLFRLILAYGFYGPATMKLGNIDGIAS